MKKIAIFPGTFDPPTLAHQNILEQAKNVFDEVIPVIGKNSSKQPFMTDLHRASAWQRLGEIPATGYDKLSIMEIAHKLNAGFIVRGIRNANDLLEEQAYKSFIEHNSIIKVVYFMTPQILQHISSSAVRAILALDNWQLLMSSYLDNRVLQLIDNK